MTNKKITTNVEVITPQIAAEYLKKNTRNRNVSDAVVRSYASTMQRGEWKLNGESIKFDTEGVLTDGQHRLLAVVKSGIPVEMLVIRDVDTDAFATYDCGRNRTAGQLMGMQGVPNYNVVSSIVGSVYRLRNNMRCFSNTTNSIASKKVLTNEQILSLFEENRQAYIRFGQYANSMRKRVGKMPINSSFSYAVAMHLVYDLGYDEGFVLKFFDNIYSFDTSDIPVLDMFRKRMLQIKCDPKNILTMSYKTNLLYKTWNCYVRGENPKCLKWSEEEGDITLLPNYNHQ